MLAFVKGGVGQDSLIYDGSRALDLDVSALGFRIAIGNLEGQHRRHPFTQL